MDDFVLPCEGGVLRASGKWVGDIALRAVPFFQDGRVYSAACYMPQSWKDLPLLDLCRLVAKRALDDPNSVAFSKYCGKLLLDVYSQFVMQDDHSSSWDVMNHACFFDDLQRIRAGGRSCSVMIRGVDVFSGTYIALK